MSEYCRYEHAQLLCDVMTVMNAHDTIGLLFHLIDYTIANICCISSPNSNFLWGLKQRRRRFTRTGRITAAATSTQPIFADPRHHKTVLISLQFTACSHASLVSVLQWTRTPEVGGDDVHCLTKCSLVGSYMWWKGRVKPSIAFCYVQNLQYSRLQNHSRRIGDEWRYR